MTAKDLDKVVRQRWMAALAKADPDRLERLIERFDLATAHHYIRAPESGLVMVRARAGGTGRRFNFGEATVTRCTLVTEDGFTGHAYIMGRNRRHAELAALMDARLQDPAIHDTIIKGVIRPLETESSRRREREARRTAATKVEFFTLVRGE